MRDLLVIPFAVRGPAKWLGRFRWLTSLFFAAFSWLAFNGWFGAALLLLLLMFTSLTNWWNLARFVDAQKNPQFRIREFR
jgi:hypothetical protein